MRGRCPGTQPVTLGQPSAKGWMNRPSRPATLGWTKESPRSRSSAAAGVAAFGGLGRVPRSGRIECHEQRRAAPRVDTPVVGAESHEQRRHRFGCGQPEFPDDVEHILRRAREMRSPHTPSIGTRGRVELTDDPRVGARLRAPERLCPTASTSQIRCDEFPPTLVTNLCSRPRTRVRPRSEALIDPDQARGKPSAAPP